MKPRNVHQLVVRRYYSISPEHHCRDWSGLVFSWLVGLSVWSVVSWAGLVVSVVSLQLTLSVMSDPAKEGPAGLTSSELSAAPVSSLSPALEIY